MVTRRGVRRRATFLAAAISIGAGLALATVSPAMAHEARTVGALELEVGLIGEPVYVGQESGLELGVTRDGAPVTGLETTLQVEVLYGAASLPLTLVPAEDGASGYTAAFIPTAAGAYSFHIHGTVDGAALDETFTSSPTGFDEVLDTAAGEFPVAMPTVSELSATASRGADSAALVPFALGAGVLGIVIGLVALGVALAGRQRPAGAG
jgi:hypothetical protein